MAHTLINMENIAYYTDNLKFMAKVPDLYYDLAIVDPQYGINAPNMNMGSNLNRKDGKGGVSTAKKLKGRLNSGAGKLKDTILNKSDIDWDDEIPGEEYFKELFRISKHQIIFGGNYFPLPPTRCIIVWDKCQPWDNFSQFELAWTSFDKPAKMFRLSNRGGNNAEEKIHPTQKPVELYKLLYKHFSFKGMKVIDTHLGSGSNRIAADMANVNFHGLENNLTYFNDQEARYNNYKEIDKKQFKIHVPVQTNINL